MNIHELKKKSCCNLIFWYLKNLNGSLRNMYVEATLNTFDALADWWLIFGSESSYPMQVTLLLNYNLKFCHNLVILFYLLSLKIENHYLLGKIKNIIERLIKKLRKWMIFVVKYNSDPNKYTCNIFKDTQKHWFLWG